MIDAGLEQNEQAITEAKRAVELEPFETSSLDAPIVRCKMVRTKMIGVRLIAVWSSTENHYGEEPEQNAKERT
jgi:hypothetical protein